MGLGKITFSVGAISFQGEGEEKWLSQELKGLIDKIPKLVEIAPMKASNDGGGAGDDEIKGNGTFTATLAKFLGACNVGDNQTRRFLATAAWLTKKGAKRVKTSDVAKALKDNHQNRLSNPADCLNKNVKSGNCEKDGASGFFVTDDGFKALGVSR